MRSIFVFDVSERIMDRWVCKIDINPPERDRRNNPGESEPIIQTGFIQQIFFIHLIIDGYTTHRRTLKLTATTDGTLPIK